jgi:putative two-component system response regulator
VKLSLKLVLVFTPLVLIWSIYAITVTSSRGSFRRVLLDHARNIMANTTELAMKRTEAYIDEARAAEQLIHRLLMSELVQTKQALHLETLFFEQLRTYPSFAGIYFATPAGDFVYVARSDDHPPAKFMTKIMSSEVGSRTSRRIWRDERFHVVYSEQGPDSYDPRKRPWFQQAWEKKSTVWNDPYIFHTSRNPGITVSGPVHDTNGMAFAVVAVDIEIAELSTFIAQLKIAQGGHLLMLSPGGDVVAYHDLAALRRPGATPDSSRLVKVQELADPACVKAFGSIPWQRDTQGRLTLHGTVTASFEFEGRPYLAMFTPSTDSRLSWFFGVYLPEDAYVGTLKGALFRDRYIMLLLSLLGTLVGLLVARSIDRPIRGIAQEVERVRRREFGGPVAVRTIYRELNEVAIAFGQMKQSLNEYERSNQALQAELKRSHLDTIIHLAACAEYKDKDTARHLKRISVYSEVLAKALGMDPQEVELIKYASPMHDIGKMGIPDHILNKAGAYTPEDTAIVEQHPAIGAKILTPHDSDLMRVSCEIALAHHEKWDGSGYPNGLAGEHIPLSARIVALVDVFDALAEKRCYKEAMPFDEAVEIIRRGSGRHFCPSCVAAFLSHLGEIKAVYQRHHVAT